MKTVKKVVAGVVRGVLSASSEEAVILGLKYIDRDQSFKRFADPHLQKRYGRGTNPILAIYWALESEDLKYYDLAVKLRDKYAVRMEIALKRALAKIASLKVLAKEITGSKHLMNKVLKFEARYKKLLKYFS